MSMWILASALWLLVNCLITIDALSCQRFEKMFSYKAIDHSKTKCFTCLMFTKRNERIWEIDCDVHGEGIVEVFKKIKNEYWSYSANYGFRGYDHIYKSINIKGDMMIDNVLEHSNPEEWINLLELSMKNMKIETLRSTFLQSFQYLKSLQLDHNDITKIEAGVFHYLQNLQVLNLSWNHIDTLYNESFQYMSDLSHIDLSHNNISHIPTNLFQHQQYLETVLMNDNSIVRFPVFKNHPGFILTTVDFSSNQLEVVEFGNDFQEVRLDRNRLKEFVVNLSSTVTVLNESHNQISVIGESSMLNATSLTHLDLSHNLLEHLPTGSFRNLKSLMSINISNNYFAESTFGPIDNWLSFFRDLSNLSRVTLDNNLWSCSDLKDILISFQVGKVTVTPAHEHNRTHLYGIGCVNVEFSKQNLSLDVSSAIGERVKSEISRLGNRNDDMTANISMMVKLLREKMLNISSRNDQLTDSSVKKIQQLQDKLDHDAITRDPVESEVSTRLVNWTKAEEAMSQMTLNQLKNDILSNMSSRINQLNQGLLKRIEQLESEGKSKSNSVQNESDESKAQIKQFVNADVEGSNLSSRIEDQMMETCRLLKTINDNSNSGSSYVIQNILLLCMLAVLSFLLYITYIFSKNKSSPSHETLNLMQSP